MPKFNLILVDKFFFVFNELRKNVIVNREGNIKKYEEQCYSG